MAILDDLTVTFTANVDFEHWAEFCIGDLKTKIRIFWVSSEGVRSKYFWFCSSTTGHF